MIRERFRHEDDVKVSFEPKVTDSPTELWVYPLEEDRHGAWR